VEMGKKNGSNPVHFHETRFLVLINLIKPILIIFV
jgi:hypothetical protein